MINNSVPTSEKTQYVSITRIRLENLIYGNGSSLFWESNEIRKYSVGKWQSYWVLKDVVHIVTTGLPRSR
jgi:hypothetical protein